MENHIFTYTCRVRPLTYVTTFSWSRCVRLEE